MTRTVIPQKRGKCHGKILAPIPSSSSMEKEPNNKEERKIDGNAIVSPKNTRRLYGKKPIGGEETEVASDEPPIPLPDDTDENMFPSAP